MKVAELKKMSKKEIVDFLFKQPEYKFLDSDPEFKAYLPRVYTKIYFFINAAYYSDDRNNYDIHDYKLICKKKLMIKKR